MRKVLRRSTNPVKTCATLGVAWRSNEHRSTMAVDSAGPAQLVLLAAVGRRYFLDGRSKVEIAEEFGFSRFKIARLIDAARESGLVRIEIRHQGEIDVDLSARLRDRYGLQHAVVMD